MTITMDQIRDVTTGKVLTDGGEKVGDVGQIYASDTSSEPTWVTVKTGLFGTAESFVPLEGARVQGSDIVVAFDKDTIKNAPRIDADGTLSPEEEQTLFRHYGVGSAGGRRDIRDDRVDDSRVGDARVGHDTSGPETDGAMTRSEEQLNVGTTREVTGRAVLRKYVVTEYVTQTIPVRHEEIRLEREDITDSNRGELVGTLSGDAAPAGLFQDDVYEVVLHKEVPVVQTQVVPVERVRLRKLAVTEQVNVSDDLRKEKIEVDDPRRTTGDTTSTTGDRL
jgi:stress response protein YsnF